MPNFVDDLVKLKLETVLGTHEKIIFSQLAGDISSRIYFKVQRCENQYIACITQKENKRQNEDFIYWRDEYHAFGLKVPKIYHYEKGFILQEHVGEKTFLSSLSEKSEKNIELFYKEAIDIMIKIHSIKKYNTKKYDYLNRERFNKEVDYSYEHLLKGYLNFTSKKIESIEKNLSLLLKKMSEEVSVVSHRDFHSKNLMLNSDSKLVVIDFQDTMLGSPFYDLASLLNDCYTNLSEGLKTRLLAHYCEQSSHLQSFHLHEVQEQFDLYSVQRVFKALGNFSAVWNNNQNPYYLRYIAFGMEKIRSITMKHDSMKDFQSSLFESYYG